MGVKLLWSLLDRRNCGRKQASFADFKGQAIAVDASKLFYDSLFKCTKQRDDGIVEPYKTQQGLLVSNVHYVLQEVVEMLDNQVLPIFVFDPEIPSETKLEELGRRNRRANSIRNELKKIEQGKLKVKKAVHERMIRESYRRRPEDDKRVKMLLELIGIPFIVSPPGVEGDLLLAALCRTVCATALTYDSDMLPLRVKSVLRQDVYRNLMDEIRLEDALSFFKLTAAELLELSILLGNDVNPGLNHGSSGGISRKAANELLRLVRRHHTVEDVLEAIQQRRTDRKFRVSRDFMKRYQQTRTLYQSVASIDLSQYNIQDNGWR